MILRKALFFLGKERVNRSKIDLLKYDNDLYLTIQIRSFPYKIDNALHELSGQSDITDSKLMLTVETNTVHGKFA